VQPILLPSDFPLWGKILIAIIVIVPLIAMVLRHIRNRRIK
jgi:hypothetical protein